MGNLTLIDYFFIYSLICIWMILLINIVLTISGYIYYLKSQKMTFKLIDEEDYPTVSILVPAHDEEMVIAKTVRSLLLLNYPKDKMELIVINDNSSDNTANILLSIQNEFSEFNFKIINTDKTNGGTGKSNALNIGYASSSGDFIAVYDADNTPDKNALKFLIKRIFYDNELGAVIGKFRTRNKEKNLLTKFINIETLNFQWLSQAGRWQLLKLCTIPGTNFVIRSTVLKKLGGWDIHAIAEDTEISFRLYKLGYKIAFMPLSVTYEQEPETLKVWFKQRTRWSKGNVYVVVKYLGKIFSNTPIRVVFDIMYYFSIYFLFLSSVIISDTLFILSLGFGIKIHLSGNFLILWILAYLLFILEVNITLTMEKGESNFSNFLLTPIMYFTYSQLWMIVAIKGIYLFIKDKLFKTETKWYKTERF